MIGDVDRAVRVVDGHEGIEQRVFEFVEIVDAVHRCAAYAWLLRAASHRESGETVDVERIAGPLARWVVGVAAVLAVAITTTVLLVDSGDEDTAATPPSTARPGVIGDTELLPLPGAADPPSTAPVLPSGPEATSSQQRSLFQAPSDTAGAARIDFNDLDEAIRKMTLDAPFRSLTRVVIGEGGFELEVRGESSDGRYVLTATSVEARAEDVVVVDLDRGTTTLRPASGRGPDVIDNDEFAANLGAIDIRMLLQQVLLGPVRPETMPFAAAVEMGPVVNVATRPDPYGRRFTIELPAPAIREWAPYLLGPTGEAPAPPDGTIVRLEVDVSSEAQIVRVGATIPYGATTQRIDHRIDWHPPEPAPVSPSSPPPG